MEGTLNWAFLWLADLFWWLFSLLDGRRSILGWRKDTFTLPNGPYNSKGRRNEGRILKVIRKQLFDGQTITLVMSDNFDFDQLQRRPSSASSLVDCERSSNRRILLQTLWQCAKVLMSCTVWRHMQRPFLCEEVAVNRNPFFVLPNACYKTWEMWHS